MYMVCKYNNTSPLIQQHNSNLSNLNDLSKTFNSIDAPSDISLYVSGQNISVKVYPPPKAEFKAPTLPPPKLPDTPPVDLVCWYEHNDINFVARW